jgi:hypothetical protein
MNFVKETKSPLSRTPTLESSLSHEGLYMRTPADLKRLLGDIETLAQYFTFCCLAAVLAQIVIGFKKETIDSNTE